MKRLARLVCGRPWIVILLNLAITGYLATGLRFAQTRPILGGELPETDPIVRDNDEFEAHYPDRNFYLFGIESTDPAGIWTVATLRKIADMSHEARFLGGALPNVQSLATWDHITARGDDIDIHPLMKEPPADAAGVARVRAIAEADPLLRGRLVSADGHVALIRIGFREDVAPSDVHREIEALRARFQGPEQIHVFGREYMNAEIDAAVGTHIGVLMPLAILLLHLFYYLCFGRIQAVLLPLLVIVCAEIDYLGLMGLLGIPTSILASSVPVILIVAVGSYIEHLMERAYSEAHDRPWREAVETALGHGGYAILLAWLTNAVGFVTLVTFLIYSIREFGILSAIAVAIGGALSLTLLPASMVVAASGEPHEYMLGRRWYLALVARCTEATVAAAGSKRRLARAFIAVTGVLAVFGITRLGVGSNPAEFFPAGHPFRTGFERLLAHFGGDGFLFVDVSAPPGKNVFDPAFLQRVAAFQQDAAEIPGIAWASSLVDRVIMRSHRAMHGGDPAYERVPESAELASAYTEVFRWSAPETLSEMSEDIDSPRRLVIDVFANINDCARVADMVGALRVLVAKHFPTESEGRAIFGGEWVLWIAQQHYIVVGKIWNVITSVPFVGLVCLWQLRSMSGALLSVLPAGFAALMVLGLMGIVGIRLDLASCVITSIVIGIGADFAIHFILRHREVLAEAGPGADPQALRETTVRLSTPPILNDALSNIVAFAVCCVSPLVPVREFGWLICLSMFASAATALTLLPGFLGSAGTERADLERVAAAEVESPALVLPNLEVAERRGSDG